MRAALLALALGAAFTGGLLLFADVSTDLAVLLGAVCSPLVYLALGPGRALKGGGWDSAGYYSGTFTGNGDSSGGHHSGGDGGGAC